VGRVIEAFLTSMIRELGATGCLILGLYWILFKPVREGAKSLKVINGELGQILECMKKLTKDIK